MALRLGRLALGVWSVLVLVGCSVDTPAAPTRAASGATPLAPPIVRFDPVVRSFPPTATPWPTFSLPPTPTPTMPAPLPTVVRPVELTPLPTLLPTITPIPPTPTLLPTFGPEVFVNRDFDATPTPAIFQVEVPGTDVKIRRQTLYMSQVGGAPEAWPTPRTTFYERTARFIGWLIDLDYSDVEPDFRMEGDMRWLKLIHAGEHVILQRPYTMDAAEGNTLFFMLGNDVPGFWTPGDYRVELWDNRDRVVAYYEFEIVGTNP